MDSIDLSKYEKNQITLIVGSVVEEYEHIHSMSCDNCKQRGTTQLMHRTFSVIDGKPYDVFYCRCVECSHCFMLLFDVSSFYCGGNGPIDPEEGKLIEDISRIFREALIHDRLPAEALRKKHKRSLFRKIFKREKPTRQSPRSELKPEDLLKVYNREEPPLPVPPVTPLAVGDDEALIEAERLWPVCECRSCPFKGHLIQNGKSVELPGGGSEALKISFFMLEIAKRAKPRCPECQSPLNWRLSANRNDLKIFKEKIEVG